MKKIGLITFVCTQLAWAIHPDDSSLDLSYAEK
jgi:hypothetical protein